ncbi:putative sodium-dependent multivitamin transporter [Halotydeus destructor]|nr:putative sodium-dependent multivitamin transporter [Halotydeus destructor]
MGSDGPSLSTVDYIVFALSLALSGIIGLYHFFVGGTQSNKQYLHANKSMGIGPVAISLMASFMSAVTLLGVPAENYTYGTQFLLINVSYIIGTPICSHIFLPVFYELNLTSAYEYLEKRFNRTVRLSASIVFMLQMTLYMGIVIYAPALALSAVTGIGKWSAIFSVGLVCTIYSALGGIKAVLWTDVFQSALMFAAVILVAIRGVVVVGGVGRVLQIANDGNRIEFFNMDLDPTTRHTVWSLAFGGIFIYCSLYGVNQTQVQRLQTLPTLGKAQIALVLSWPITSLLSFITSFTGIVMYAYFQGCDPLKSGKITSSDQMLPYFMMDIMGDIPGLPGLFVAGIFAGAISSVSSFVNSLSAITLEDYIKPFVRTPMKESTETLIAKFLSLFYGLTCIGLTYFADKTTGLVQASLTIFGIVGGPLLGLFTLGMCSKFSKSNAALISFFISLFFGFWMGFGTLYYGPKPATLELRTDECPEVSTLSGQVSNATASSFVTQETFYLYRISYMYYAFITWAICVILGTVLSCMSCGEVSAIDDELISPPFRWLNRSQDSFEVHRYDDRDGVELKTRPVKKGSVALI